jgi:hypothetical protein
MIVTSTPVEKALDELRARFPNGIVIGFEELFDPRPDKEPQLDLGPTGSSLEQVLNRVRTIDPKYRVELLQSGLVHVYPAKETADPVGLLDIRIRQSSMPQDSCLPLPCYRESEDDRATVLIACSATVVMTLRQSGKCPPHHALARKAQH